ncbi:MAG TPA: hypothetical protein VL688_06625 [Verrucomicrobiae bacterium]|jgi:hypothetical protein|nr:hypothetical protein [Verrucomicrobiae bacterium]
MHTDPHSTSSNKEGYEKRDAQVKPILIFCLILCVTAVVVQVGLYVYYKLLAAHETKQDAPSIYVRDDRWHAPDVTLEVHPSREYEQMREEEEILLNNYQWRDPEHERVSIPVSKAMEIMLKKGFPVRSENAAPPQQERTAS